MFLFCLFVCLFVFFFFFYPHGKSLFICLEITSLYELEALPWWKVAQRLNSNGGGGGGGGGHRRYMNELHQ